MTGSAPAGQPPGAHAAPRSRGRTCRALLVAALLTGGLLLADAACAPAGFDPLAAPAPAPSTVPAATLPMTPSSPTPTPTSTAQPEDAQTSIDRLFAAALTGDRDAWDDRVATSGTGFADRAALLFTNLHLLRPARLRVRLTGAEQVVSAQRRSELGGSARIVQAELSWRLKGERAYARSSVWLTLVPGPRGLALAGTEDGTSLDTPALPLWWLAPVSRMTKGDVTVIVGPGQAPGRWAALAVRAAKDVHEHLPAVLRQRWDGHLVVEVPGNEVDFTRVLGAAPSTYAGTAAVTRPEGPTTEAAVRVVVNPVTATETDDELGTTLTHETVHVATASAQSHAPLWAVEGLAEYVALEAHPGQRGAETAALRTAPMPVRLPGDSAFTEGGKDVTASYAQAWLACRSIAAHRSRTDLGRLYVALDRGESLSKAGSSTIEATEPVVLGWWRAAMASA